ncbi:hypothetical protein [Paenibacillus sp. ALJ109b]|uniref:hypothetical protein n=1 Tax=Paenibacillus sp. ALJ109b TaxID=2709068 RepID=UPI0013D8011B|nr:hypothetical protein [Paenibacillus sp. ALJ109b]NEU63896.1 hypothetical protein [Paenibacillus sp. ALJ109b]
MMKVSNIFVSCLVFCILMLNLSALVSAEPNIVNEEEFKPLSLTLLKDGDYSVLSKNSEAAAKL